MVDYCLISSFPRASLLREEIRFFSIWFSLVGTTRKVVEERIITRNSEKLQVEEDRDIALVQAISLVSRKHELKVLKKQFGDL